MSATGYRAGTADEAALVLQVRQGDTAAFGSIVQRFLRPALAIAFRIVGQREDAEDVVQESFMAALDGLDGFDLRRSFAPWFFRIVVNRSLNMRRARNRHATESLSVEFRADTASPAAAVERHETEACVRRALEQLPERQRTIVQLNGFEGMNSARIGELLDIPAGTVRWELHQARAALRNHLAACTGGAP